MPRSLRGAVVVITGASSGIGRAAAHGFAREGAQLVLAARARSPLEDVAQECGGEPLVAPTDVRDEEAVQVLAARAVERFGRIDVWVNGAGVMVYGRFEDIPADVFRQVIETNVLGQVHGARAALAEFRRRGKGVLINMSSVWGRVTTPAVSPYVTSKFAVRAFSECLRHELRDTPGIAVAAMLPAAVDTPIFRWAGNFSGRAVRPVPPVLDPVEVAEGILKCARDPKREVTYGRVAMLLELVHSLAPGLYERFAADAFTAGNFGDAPADLSAGNVLQPPPGPYGVDGGWRREHKRALADAFVAAAGAAVRGLWRR
jgi:NAD(P)-dependent dehydrogenase (short-subunit alcohol dehydrogenase family)